MAAHDPVGLSPDTRLGPYEILTPPGAGGMGEFPGTRDRVRVSRDGGMQAAWRGDSRERYFLGPDGTMMASAVAAGSGFQADTAEPVHDRSPAQLPVRAVPRHRRRPALPAADPRDRCAAAQGDCQLARAVQERTVADVTSPFRIAGGRDHRCRSALEPCSRKTIRRESCTPRIFNFCVPRGRRVAKTGNRPDPSVEIYGDTARSSVVELLGKVSCTSSRGTLFLTSAT
jgi:hypothetical protein